MDRSKKKVRLAIESLEVRAVPAQLGQVVTLPEVTGHGPGAVVALTAPADPGHGGNTSLKIDPGVSANVKIDPSAAATVKLAPSVAASIKYDPSIRANVKLDPSGVAGLKIDTSLIHKDQA